MRVETFYPVDQRLKSCIEYYYFLESDTEDFCSEYFAFPNTLQALNIHRNIACEIDDHSVRINGTSEGNFTILLQGRFEIPLHARLKGRINKITVIFKPLGLNHFITSPFERISGKPTQYFTEWDDHEKHKLFLNDFFSEPDLVKRIGILEEYLLLHYRPLTGIGNLRQSLTLLCDFSNELSIEQIAQKTGQTTRSFNRTFRQFLGISPIGYKKIARFRHSMQNKMFAEQYQKLTEIGYASNFYDQSYFIKMYRKLTNTTPGEFFDQVDKLAEDQLILKFIDKQ